MRPSTRAHAVSAADEDDVYAAMDWPLERQPLINPCSEVDPTNQQQQQRGRDETDYGQIQS